LRLDPLSLPVSFDAHDVRADGGIRNVELHRERVVLRRAVQGMRMAIQVRVSEPAARRRRRNAICSRRPKFLMRRRGGGPLDASDVHRGEREISARN